MNELTQKGGALSESITPMPPEHALAMSLGENALFAIGKSGLHALAVTMHDDGVCDLIVVPDHETTLEDVLHWEHQTGELNLLFHGESHIDLCIMNHHEFHALVETDEPEFKMLADA